MDTTIYKFSKTDHISTPLAEMTALLGGKGAGLQMMARQGLPVPPGFTIPTTACNAYRVETDLGVKEQMVSEITLAALDNLLWLRQQFDFTPLVSVRSGAPISMPGMMDTILNVGLCDDNIALWEQRIGERAAWDSYRRLIQMLGHTAYGVSMVLFDEHVDDVKEQAGVTEDRDLTADDLRILVSRFKMVFQAVTQEAFPQNSDRQLRAAIKAVFDSWMNDRAIEYRKINSISEAMGTAVTVQAMVFGNMGDTSGSGVLFSRNPSTGVDLIMAEYLANAQGEDVVAGIRTPDSLMLNGELEGWQDELAEVTLQLENSYKDMVDIEFTVQNGQLFILQSRTGKRSARAAFKIAYDLVDIGLIDKATALSRLLKEQFKTVRLPMIDPAYTTPACVTGLPACPGIVSGRPVFSSEDAVAATDKVILVTHETTPDDIAGMHKAAGILTQTGGATSHAAVVARAMDKPCVVGCTVLDLDALQSVSKVTIDGATGRVWLDQDVPVIPASDAPEIKTITGWCLEASGYAEQVAVPSASNQRVMAAHWWNDMLVAEAVINKLTVDPMLKNIVIDLTTQLELHPVSDNALTFAFASDEQPDSSFRDKVVTMMLAQGAALEGTTVIGNLTTVQRKALIKNGLKVSGEAKTVADLIAGGTTTPDFVSNVIGGEDALKTLVNALKVAGIEYKAVADAVPADFAAFTILK